MRLNLTSCHYTCASPIVVGDTAYVPLGGKKGFALIDAEDAAVVGARSWQYCQKGHYTPYARANRDRSAGAGKHPQVWMHRVVINVPDGMVVDHINGDGLDNRKANLRIVTQNENMVNRRFASNNRSGVTNVYWCNTWRKWKVVLKRNCQRISVGTFAEFDDAVQARNAFLKKWEADYESSVS